MSTCTIRYRLDAGGPAVFVVEASDGYHFYSHGQLGPVLPGERLPQLLASRSRRWVKASGTVSVSDRQMFDRSYVEHSLVQHHGPATADLGAM